VDGAIVRGHVGGEKVLLVRRKEDYFAIGAECTHYHAQLANVLIVDETIRLVGSLRGDGAHEATAGW
jgi:3-phenylpropionate/trans-cinnamate dioxygenase ferredoxin reductase subunit